MGNKEISRRLDFLKDLLRKTNAGKVPWVGVFNDKYQVTLEGCDFEFQIAEMPIFQWT